MAVVGKLKQKVQFKTAVIFLFISKINEIKDAD